MLGPFSGQDWLFNLSVVTILVLAYTMVTTVLRVLGHRVHRNIIRHELIVASKQMRLDYLATIRARAEETVVIEDIKPPAR